MPERIEDNSGQTAPKRPRRDFLRLLGLAGLVTPVYRGIVLSEAFHGLWQLLPRIPEFIRQENMASEFEMLGFEFVPFSPDQGTALNQNPQDNSKLTQLQESYSIPEISDTATALNLGLNLVHETTDAPHVFVLPRETALSNILVCSYGDKPVIYELQNSEDGPATLVMRQAPSDQQETGTSHSVIFVSFDIKKLRSPSILEP